MDARRFDTHSLANARRDDRGFLRIPANLTRPGVFPYRRADGTVVREYRPPEEVFAADALASLKGAPVTDLHPTTPVDATNIKALGIGRVGYDVKRDGDYVSAELVIEDADAISAVERGDRKEISLGYGVRIDATPGVTPDGEPYDVVQRGYRFNHAALGPANWGRISGAGLRADESDDGFRLDSADAVLVEGEPPSKHHRDSRRENDVIKYRLDDGTTVEVADEAAAKVLDGVLKARADESAKHKAAADAERARADAAEARADKAEGERDALKADAAGRMDAGDLQKAMTARLKLISEAQTVLGGELTIDSPLSDREVREKVVAKAFPTIKLTTDAGEKRSDDYVAALYDSAIAGRRNDGLILPPAPPAGAPAPDQTPNVRRDAHAAFLASHRKAG